MKKDGGKERAGRIRGLDMTEGAGLEDVVKDLLSRGISRRDFMRWTAGAGIMLSVGHIFQGCSGSSSGTQGEARTYFFDLSQADSNSDSNYYVVSGSNHYRLQRADNLLLETPPPLLSGIPSGITHYVDAAQFPGNSHQLCYVKSVQPGSSQWKIVGMFIHIPESFENALTAYKLKNASSAGSHCGNGVSGKGSNLHSAADTTDYCTKYGSNYKSYFDTAKSLIFHHPDIMSLDTGTATYVLNNIICSLSQTLDLAVSIYHQVQNGGSWAVQTPIIDDTTGRPYKNTQGQDQYSITWTDETSKYVGRAVLAILKAIKNDPALYANVTDRTSGGSGQVSNSDLKGKICLMRDGVPSVNQSRTSARNMRRLLKKQAASSAFNYTLCNQSTERGFNIPSFSADPSTRQVSVEAHNWYIRYLGLYVRYLDANGKAIKIPDNIKSTMADWQQRHSGDYDALWGVIEPEMAILGIPIEDFDHTFSFPVPDSASSVVIVAGGLGTGSTDYTEAVPVGATATIVVNLAIPTLFMMSAACAGYATFAKSFQGDSQMIAMFALVFAGLMDEAIFGETNDSKVFYNLAGAFAGFLLKKLAEKGLTWLTQKLFACMAEGEVIDSIPLIGCILSAIAAAGTAAQIGETVSEVVRSPKTFDYKMVFTHDVTITIYNDPQDTVGFPATAATYEVIAVLDGATTRRSGPLALTSFRVDPSHPYISYTFTGLPYGGKVKFSVGFFAKDGWVAGQGETTVMDNNVGSASITIKENKVPLNSSTYYWHLQKTALDSSGNIIWSGNQQSPAPAPTAKKDALACSNTPGSLCSLGGITASETYAAIGFTWQSYSSAISQYGGTGTGQLYQFRTLSLMSNPESSEITSGYGSRLPFRTVFSLLGADNNNYYLDPTSGRFHIRQIRFSAPGGPASYDAPGSNSSFGRLNLSSDGMLLHPLRKIISINQQMSVMEILNLPGQASADSSAPLATTASGEGLREGLMSGPICTAMTADGTILILESGNNRVQAFDTGANPVKLFGNKTAYFFPLKTETEGVFYLDMAVEYAGYIYILSYGSSSNVYRLDIYDPQGNWMSRTSNVNAGALTIDFWRNVYTLNYEALTAKGITSPSVSLWIPSVP